MMWGCMTWEGIGYATKIDGKMDADLYIQILEDELQSTIQYYNKTSEDIIFQQDNDPKHTSNKAKKCFARKLIKDAKAAQQHVLVRAN